MKPTVTILVAMEDLFAQHFKDLHSWRHWRGFLSVLFGLVPDEFGRRATSA